MARCNMLMSIDDNMLMAHYTHNYVALCTFCGVKRCTLHCHYLATDVNTDSYIDASTINQYCEHIDTYLCKFSIK